jgi:hypothetical protein
MLWFNSIGLAKPMECFREPALAFLYEAISLGELFGLDVWLFVVVLRF